MKSQTAYVLVHRLELEEHANQTENAVPYLFETEDDAIAKACELMRETTAEWGWAKEDQDEEAAALTQDLSDIPCTAPAANMHSDHLVHLTDSDNEVFELYLRGIARKGHTNPEA